jgi:uncharacterized membrane protein
VSTTFWIIVAGAVLTYLTRIGGYLAVSRFERIHPRVEAGLNAVPAAVLTTLFAPAVMEGGPAEWLALAAATVIAFSGGSFIVMFLVAAGLLVLLRQYLG